MNVSEMFEQSVVVTLLSMSVVFGFLIIMIITITIAGKVIKALGWDVDLKAAPEPVPAAAPANAVAVTAAITAAVAQYRKTHS